MLTAHCKVIVEDDVLVHKHVGTRVICDRESEGAEVEAVMSSPSRVETELSLQEGSRIIESVDVQLEIEEEMRKESIDGQAPYFLLPLEDGHFTSDKCVLKSIVMATPPANVQWTVNDVQITEDLNHRVITEDGIAILQITNISSEELRITCTATNDYGEAVTKCYLSRKSSEESISERGQKPFFVLPLKDVESYDDEVQLKCVVSGEPLPTVSWQLDGEELEERYGTTICEDGVAIVLLKNLEEGVHIIECLAENSMGRCTTSAVVRRVERKGKYGDEGEKQEVEAIPKEVTLTEQFAEKLELVVQKLEHIVFENEEEKSNFTITVRGTLAQQAERKEETEHTTKTSTDQIVEKLEQIVEQLEQIVVEREEQKDEVTLTAPTTVVESAEQKISAPTPEEKPAPESEKAPELVEKKVEEVVVETREVEVVEKEGEATIIIEVELRRQEEVSGLEIDLL
ncbi:immunoglobulin I-set domain protein, partial [Ancylostoma duodenale]